MKKGSFKLITKETLKAQAEQKPAAPQSIQPVLFEVDPKAPEPTAEDQFNYKVPDVIFWQVMRKAYGICGRAARLFKQDHEIEISRQAVHARANRNPDMLDDCREGLIDTAEEVIVALLTQTTDKKVRADMAKHITKTLGKARGYSEKSTVSHEGELTVKSVTIESVPVSTPFATSEKDIDDTPENYD